jgi:hypothetical protein
MKKLLWTIVVVLVLFLGCERVGLDGKSSLMDLMTEPAGDNCSAGGFKIISGIDLNSNNTLDEKEIQNTEYVCNGTNSLLKVIPEPIGDNCSSGGYKIISGMDMDNNDTLDNSEIQNTEYICNGDNGGYDKTVLIDFPPLGGYGTSSSTGEVPEFLVIRNFNISDYIDADSVVFGIYLQSNDIENNFIVELYDITKNEVINNSLVKSNTTVLKWITTTTNFISDFPNGSFDLGIRMKSETEGIGGQCMIPMLMIYRK